MAQTPEKPAGTNTLVLAPSVSDTKDRHCTGLLSELAEPPTLLKVSYTSPADAVVDEWQEAAGPSPADVYVVRVRERLGRGNGDDASDGTAATVAMANPNDLTGMAMRLRDVIAEASSSERQLVVCFDSLTSLLQYTDMEPAYRFLHMFTGQLRDVGAVAHFHLDPAAFDERTISRVRSVFDEVVTGEE